MVSVYRLVQALFMVSMSVVCWASIRDDDTRTIQVLDIKMPSVQPDQRETYLCRSVKVDSEENYIIKFVPKANMYTVHHMILYGCASPALNDEVWNCGGMHTTTVVSKYPRASVCDGRLTILYAWAMDAPELTLPEDVGFRIGRNSRIQYLVLQVHYLEPLTGPDNSGLTVHMTREILPKTAGVLFMATLGRIRAHTKEHFEATCIIKDEIELHPFAFRVHTHRLGKVVSGYLVRNKDWYLIGKKNPQEPQMFYPVADNSLVIRKFDMLTARCTMENLLDKDVYIGATSDDEMCNYYMMYWVNGTETLTSESCTTWGPPNYFWTNDIFLANTNIPDADASTLPGERKRS